MPGDRFYNIFRFRFFIRVLVSLQIKDQKNKHRHFIIYCAV
jgi:hypothetical protein